MSTSGFGKKIAGYQDEILEKRDAFTNDIEDVRERLFSPQVSVSSSKVNWILWGATGVVASAAVILLLIFWQGSETVDSDPATPTAKSLQGQWLYASESDKTVAFSDASEILLEQGATARVLNEEGHSVHFLLEQGRAHVNVIHYEDTRWVLDVGPYKVNVIGTTFTISWAPAAQKFSLTLDEGTVEIFGPMVESGRRVSRKETFTASVLQGTVEIQSAEPVKLALDTENSSDPGHSSVADAASDVDAKADRRPRINARSVKNGKDLSVESADSTPISWVQLNREGQFSQVVAEAKAMGVQTALNQRDVSDVMALGDAARLQREWQLAQDAYLALRARSPQSKNAATAAFSIGKIAFDSQRNYSVASQWLETYLREQPSGRLAREALGRLMEARDKSGNSSGARSAAREYLEKYPTGPHSELARKINN